MWASRKKVAGKGFGPLTSELCHPQLGIPKESGAAMTSSVVTVVSNANRLCGFQHKVSAKQGVLKIGLLYFDVGNNPLSGFQSKC